MDRFAPPTAEDDPKVIGKCQRCHDDIYEGEPQMECSCEQVVCECCVTTCGICNKKYCDDCIIPNWENTGIWVCRYCDESGAAQEKLITETETSNDPAAQYVANLCRTKIAELKVLTELHDEVLESLRQCNAEIKWILNYEKYRDRRGYDNPELLEAK